MDPQDITYWRHALVDYQAVSGGLPNISPSKFKAECERLAALFAAADTDEDEMIIALYDHDWMMDVDWFETDDDTGQAGLEILLSAVLALS